MAEKHKDVDMLNKSKAIKKSILQDYGLPIILQIVVLAVLILVFYYFVSAGPLLQEPEMVGDEMSSPTMGRLVYMFISFFLALGLGIAAHISAKKKNDKRAFWCGFAAGVLLWQSVGEQAWHFSVADVHFVQLEGVQAFPIVILFAILLIYGYKNRSFDWGIWCVIASFACNWLSHYVLVGIYPFVENIIALHDWYVWTGSIFGLLVLSASIWYLIRNYDSLKARLFASMLTYVSIGIVMFSFIEK